jgi:hypothetical protein
MEEKGSLMNSLFELFFIQKLQDQEHQLPTERWHGNPFVFGSDENQNEQRLN